MGKSGQAPRKNYATRASSSTNHPSLMKSAHVNEAKRSLQVANKWRESALYNLKLAKNNFEMVKRQLKDAEKNALLANKMVEKEKVNVQGLEKKYEVISVED